MAIKGVQAQTLETPFVFLFDINIKANLIAADQLRNIYVVNDKNQLIQYNNEGKETFRYSENYFGNITKIDTYNPLNILLWYADFKTVAVLERTLASSYTLNLLQTGLGDPLLVAAANDGNIWVYDAADYGIKKINRNGDIIIQSRPLNTILDTITSPIQMSIEGNLLYVNFPDKGILIFDQFGKFIKIIDIKNIKYFQVFNQQLFYYQLGQYFRYHLQSFEKESIILPDTTLNYPVILFNRLILTQPNKITIWELR